MKPEQDLLSTTEAIAEESAQANPNSATESVPKTDLAPLLDILSEPEIKRRSGAKWIVGSGVLLVVALSGWWGYNSFLKQPVEPVAISTMPVEIGSVEVTITESGTVELDGQQTFKSPSDVTVEAVQVQERQRVPAGTVLLLLRNRGLQGDLVNQKIQNQQAENSLARKQEVIEEQQEKLRKAQERLADSESLFNRGFISEDAYRQDQQGVEDAISAIKDAEVELTNVRLDIEKNQLMLENILTQLSDNQIVSPMDAVVLNVDVKPGDGVAQGGQLLTIGDPYKETVRLQLTTLNAAKVKLNMPVEVSLIGPNPQVFAGRISRVSPQVVSNSQGSSSGGESQGGTVEAEAILDAPSNGTLIPGSVVSVEIVLDRQQSVVTVPLTAIQTEGETQFVWVKDAQGNAQKRTVSVGLENLQSAAILSGLQAGEEIVPALPPDAALVPGMPLADAESVPSDFAAPPAF